MPTRTKSKGVPPAAAKSADAPITTAQIHVPLLDKIRVIRQRRGLTVPEVFDKFAAPTIEEEYRRCVTEMAAEFADC